MDGLFHIVDWTPTLAAIAGVSEERIQQLKLDGKNQKDFILNQGESVRREFVYNIKTSPFKVRKFKNLTIDIFIIRVSRLVTAVGSTRYSGEIMGRMTGTGRPGN